MGYLGRIRAGVKSMVEQIAEALCSRDPGRTVSCLIAPGLRVKGDLVLLRAVLENLLSNAWKYTGRKAEAEVGKGATFFFSLPA
jgi:signal transduction histidine kinase